MKLFLFLSLFMCSISYSKIPDFTHLEKLDAFPGTGGQKGAICFVNWDNDELTDILWVNNGGNSTLKFFKNVGTLSSPSYEDMGFVKNDSGNVLSYYHG